MAEAGEAPPPPQPEGEAEQKVVFAPRIDKALKAQVEDLQEITGQNNNQVGTQALELWVAAVLADEEVRAKAMAGIEEEALRLEERRERIQRALGAAANTPDKETPGSSGRGGRRGKSSSD